MPSEHVDVSQLFGCSQRRHLDADVRQPPEFSQQFRDVLSKGVSFTMPSLTHVASHDITGKMFRGKISLLESLQAIGYARYELIRTKDDPISRLCS